MTINKTTLYSTGLGESVSDGKGGLLVNGSVIYVDTIADLQALPTSGLVDGQKALVSNKSGFVWVTGDQSVNVASYPREYISLSGDDGTVGAFKADFAMPKYTIRPTDASSFVTDFNSLMSDLGDSPASITVETVDFTLDLTESLLFKRNKKVDLGWNNYRISDGANTYAFLGHYTDISGFLTIQNFYLDGNTANQTRNFGTISYNDPTYGDIYEPIDNYVGFGIYIQGFHNVYISDYSIKDTEAWGIAHYLCDTFISERGEFDQESSGANNSDGITGIATRVTIIRDITGYTNDDFFAVSAARASIGSFLLFNPANGIDVDLFLVENITPVKKNTRWPYTLMGVYVSDGKTIRHVEARSSSAYYQRHVVRTGNYWANTFSAPDGLILYQKVSDVAASAITDGESDFDFSNVEIGDFYSSAVKSDKSDGNVGAMSDCPVYHLRENAFLRRMDIDGFYFENNTAPADVYNSFVRCENGSDCQFLSLSGHYVVSSGREADTTLYRNDTVNITRLNIGTTIVDYPTGRTTVDTVNVYVDTADGFVEIDGCSVTLQEGLSLPVNVSAGTYTPYVLRNGGNVTLEGSVVTNASYTLGDNLFESLPFWALPDSSQSRMPITAFKAGVSSQAPLAVVRSSSAASTVNGSGGDFSDATIYLNGSSWSAV